MKSKFRQNFNIGITVAPLVGAWIEIISRLAFISRVRVAPLVGAWIEIYMSEVMSNTKDVAPLVGAWIEIMRDYHVGKYCMSLPLWERGLK